MKTVLILAYDFPPYVSVGGLRPHYWYEHFKEMGIYPVVITRNWNPIHGSELDYIQPSDTDKVIIEETELGTLVKTPYKTTLSNRLNLKEKNDIFSNILKKISTGWNEMGQWFLPIGTKYEIYKAARSYLKANKVDLILATGEPFVLFHYAAKLSKEFGVKWVADYRDPWSDNTSRSKSSPSFRMNVRNERLALRNVAHITTVSDFMKKKIEQIIGKKPIAIFPNGFNENAFEGIKTETQNTEVLTISLAGTIYDWHPYLAFLQTIHTYLVKYPEKRLKIHFYGINKEQEIQALITQNENLKEVVVFHPRMKNLLLLREMAKSNVLLLFNYYSYMGTKIYDYLALNRKILLCFEDDMEAQMLKEKYYNMASISGLSESLQADLIHSTNSGIVVKDREQLEKVLDDLFEEFEQRKYIENHTIGAENYSRKIQTERLVKLLIEISNKESIKD
ncbi:MAG: glycosyltransferase [Brumimicrobium sp.]|nr:glycosyltransferase [Brumimicrobium sp.]